MRCSIPGLIALAVLGCAPTLWPTYSDGTAAPMPEVSACAQGSAGRLGYAVSGSDTLVGRLYAEREDVSNAARDSVGIRRYDVLEIAVAPRQSGPGSQLEVQARAYSIHPGAQGAVRVDEVATSRARIDARRVVDECAALRGVAAPPNPSPSGY
jgi:hypothetical protein